MNVCIASSQLKVKSNEVLAKSNEVLATKRYLQEHSTKAAAKIKLSFVSHMQRSAASAFKDRVSAQKKREIREKIKRVSLVSGVMTEKLGDVREQHEVEAKAREEAEAAHKRATAGSFSTTSSTPKNRTGEAG